MIRNALSALLAFAVLATPAFAADTATHHRTAKVDGIEIFYREAGPRDAPVVVLLHGFPSSSHMYRNLIPALAPRYRVIAPDYPGFGESAVPPRGKFEYSFARFAEITDSLLASLGADRYAIYIQDYGAPVGLRLALRHPERVTALIVQNGNAYEDGLGDFWKPLRAYWASGSAQDREPLRAGLTLASTQHQYLDGVRDPSRVDPASWSHDQARLDRPGVADIQLDLFYDYRKNVELYPKFHQFFRDRQPPTLITWGRNDQYFIAPGALAYLRDLPRAELHLLDTGHFALEDQGETIAMLMNDFLGRHLPAKP